METGSKAKAGEVVGVDLIGIRVEVGCLSKEEMVRRREERRA